MLAKISQECAQVTAFWERISVPAKYVHTGADQPGVVGGHTSFLLATQALLTLADMFKTKNCD